MSEAAAADLPWLGRHMDGGVGSLATVLLASSFIDSWKKTDRYSRRMVAAYERTWDDLHARTVSKLAGSPLRLDSFSPMDVREYMADVARPDAGFVSFPPFWGGGYEKLFANLDDAFDWPAPDYPELDDAGKLGMVETAMDRPHWMLGIHVDKVAFGEGTWEHPHPDLAPYLRGFLETGGGVPIIVYGSADPRRIARPDRATAAVKLPKIGEEDVIGDRVALHPLTPQQWEGLRSQFLAKNIHPGACKVQVAVTVDGKIVGAFGLDRRYDRTSLLLLSDFAVGWSRYRRLSKLIVMVAMSREAQVLLERKDGHRVSRTVTFAYSKNPQAAKYGRGIPGMRLASRKEEKGGGTQRGHRWTLRYEGPLGDWTAQEALDMWKQRHAKDVRA